MLTFLELNSIIINCSDEEIIILGLEIASGKFEQEDIITWIKKYS